MYCLQFPENPQDRHSESYQLVAPGRDDSETDDVKLEVQHAKRVVTMGTGGPDTPVIYKADLHGNILDEPCRVVCKCATGPGIKPLSREAQVYRTQLAAAGLQGHYVPRFLGLYYGKHPDGYEVAIMVLSDEGRPMTASLEFTPLYFRCVFRY